MVRIQILVHVSKVISHGCVCPRTVNIVINDVQGFCDESRARSCQQSSIHLNRHTLIITHTCTRNVNRKQVVSRKLKCANIHCKKAKNLHSRHCRNLRPICSAYSRNTKLNFNRKYNAITFLISLSVAFLETPRSSYSLLSAIFLVKVNLFNRVCGELCLIDQTFLKCHATFVN